MKHTSPIKAEKKVKLLIYYKNRTLRNLFIKNSNGSQEHFNVVYKYVCNLEPCSGSETYIEHTTTLLKQRILTHTQQGAIRKHNDRTHKLKMKTQELLNRTEILTRCNNRCELQITEALMIQAMKPSLNEQNYFTDRTLKIF